MGTVGEQNERQLIILVGDRFTHMTAFLLFIRNEAAMSIKADRLSAASTGHWSFGLVAQ